MKRIIDGKTYNTETATLVARYAYVEADNKWGQESRRQADLYITRGGALFEVEDDSLSLWPVTRGEAEDHISKGHAEIFDTSVFAEPEEAAAEQGPEATIYVRVPRSLKDRIEAGAKDDEMSVNAWVMRCVERCASQARAADALWRAHYIATSITTVPDGYTEQQCHEAFQEIANEIESAWGHLGLPRQKGHDLGEDVTLYGVGSHDHDTLFKPWEPYQHEAAST